MVDKNCVFSVCLHATSVLHVRIDALLFEAILNIIFSLFKTQFSSMWPIFDKKRSKRKNLFGVPFKFALF